MTDLTELKRLAEAATPGDWRCTGGEVQHCDFPDCDSWVATSSPVDAAFIATANPSAILSLIQRVEEAEAYVAFTLSDQARLLRREDVAAACPSPDTCFEYGPVRCEPCAVKASAEKGVKIEYRHSCLPEVCRLKREAGAAHAKGRLAGIEEAAKCADFSSKSATDKFDQRVDRARKGEKNLELAAATAAGMDHAARNIAQSICALKEKAGD